MKQMTQRQRQVAEMVRQSVAASLTRGDFSSPELPGALVNVSAAWVSPDLRMARVYFTLLNLKADVKTISQILNAEAWQFQKSLGNLGLKFTPKLTFFYDTQEEQAEHLDMLFRQLAAQ